MIRFILTYGTGIRQYGKVDRHDGQYAVTRFGHLFFVPLFPISSVWVIGGGGEGQMGHAVKLSGKSVLAGYLRVWMLVAAAIGLVVGGTAGYAVAGLAVPLWAASWLLVPLRGAGAHRRADWYHRTFGTACDPMRMRGGMLASVRAQSVAAFARHADSRTPEDVARLGPANADQARAAYAVLRIAAAEADSPARRGDALAAAERIFDHRPGDATTAGDPYRAPMAS